jgi:hypothetical protein
MILLIRIGGVGMHVYDVSLARIEITQTVWYHGYILKPILTNLATIRGYSTLYDRYLLHPPLHNSASLPLNGPFFKV